MQPDDADVLLAGALLTLYQPRGPVDADDEAARDLWVERARVTRLFDAQDAADPRDDLVRRRVRRLVEVDDAVAHVLGQRALERRRAGGDRRVVAGAHVEPVVVAQQQRPL